MTDRGTLTLFHSPRACSLACAIALAASGLEHEIKIVDIRKGENRSPTYLAINPKGTVPTLRIDAELLTEAHAILTWIADNSSERMLPAAGSLLRARAHEWMNFLSSTVHPAFRSVFRPEFFVGTGDVAAIREVGFGKLAAVIPEIERRLSGGPFALGAASGVVDFYIFVFFLWSFDERLGGRMPERPILRSHAERVFALPATRRTLALSNLDVGYAGLTTA